MSLGWYHTTARRLAHLHCHRWAVTILLAGGTMGSCGEPRKDRRAPEPQRVVQSALEASKSVPTTWPDDAWSDVAPEDVGLSSAFLVASAERIRDNLPEVRALLVVKNGKMAFERYFGGVGPQEMANTKSVTKSVVSALVGIAIARNRITGIDAPITTWLSPEIPETADPRVRTITLRHLLSMTAGFEWQENGPSTAEWLRSPDRVRFTLASPLRADPGEEFNYNTGASHLLSIVLARATGGDVAAFAETALFAPIGATVGTWSTDPQGFYEGGSELWLTPRDMARFGLLLLRKGRWRDRQVIPESWVLESTRPHGRVDYGFLWWHLPEEWGGPAINALGYGGQLISVVPAADAVIVMSSTTTNPDNPVLTLLRETLLPGLLADPQARREGQ